MTVLQVLKKQTTGILQAQNMLHMPLNYRRLLVGASHCRLRKTANYRNKVLVTSGLVRTEGKNLSNPSQYTFRYCRKYPAIPTKLHITKTKEGTDRRKFRFCLNCTAHLLLFKFLKSHSSVLWLLFQFC